MDILEIKEFIRDSFKTIALIVIIFVIISYGFSLQQVVGSSMENTLSNGDILILNKFRYKISDVKRGDIVAVYNKDNYIVKRIIGIPGDSIKVVGHKLYINGKKVNESYIGYKLTDDFQLIEKVPKGKYFIMGDNRNNSIDSRDPNVGFIDKKQIVGKSIVRFWPISKFKIL